MQQLVIIAVLVMVSAAEIMLALVALVRSPRDRVNQMYGLMTAGMVVWGAVSYYDQTAAANDPLLPILGLVPFAAAAGIAYFFISFAFYFPETIPVNTTLRRIALITLAVAGIAVSLLALTTNTIVGEITSGPHGNHVEPGRLYIMFIAYFLTCVIWGLVHLYQKYRHTSNPIIKDQLSYVFGGLLITLVIGFSSNVLLPLISHNSLSARFGFMTTLGMVLFIGYAIVAHQLFDFKLVVARSVAFIMILTALAAIYIGGLLLMISVIFPDLDFSPAEIAITVTMALAVAISLPALRHFFERATDRIFFRDHYDVQALLDRVSSIFATELELKPLMQKFLKELTGTMRLVNAQLVVMDGKSVYGQASQGKLNVEPLGPDSLPVFNHSLMIADLMPASHPKHVMSAQGIQVVTQLRAHGELVGYLALGDKQAGTVYSNQDLAVIEIMRKELAVAVANAKAYDEISQFNVTLQQRIRDATKRLKVANSNLRALDKTKDEFISMASHQLGTPLTAITGYLSMALDNDKHNMTQDQKEFVSYALEAAEKMVYMSGDMLNVSRLNSGRFMIQRQPAELVSMVQQEMHQLEPAAARKGLSLTADLPDVPVTIELDESKTRQVIMNFIDNALYYTESGGVHVKLEQTSNQVKLTVTDTGIGVPAAQQPKLFVKFYRADNAKQVRPDGTGLGLYLAKRVIEDQGGQLIFTSVEGKGSTFGFTLPRS